MDSFWKKKRKWCSGDLITGNVSGGAGLKATPTSVTVDTATDVERVAVSIHDHSRRQQSQCEEQQQFSHEKMEGRKWEREGKKKCNWKMEKQKRVLNYWYYYVYMIIASLHSFTVRRVWGTCTAFRKNTSCASSFSICFVIGSLIVDGMIPFTYGNLINSSIWLWLKKIKKN